MVEGGAQFLENWESKMYGLPVTERVSLGDGGRAEGMNRSMVL